MNTHPVRTTLRAALTTGALALALSACQESVLAFPSKDAGVDSGVILSCGTGTLQCADKCVAIKYDNAHCGACGVACSAAEACANGTCYPRNCSAEQCATDQVCMNSTQCTDILCVGVTCSAGQVCKAGQCQTVQPSCDGGVMEDPNNCGACGTVCATPVHAPARCSAGHCGRGPCAAGFYDVDGDATPGCESTCAGLVCTLPDGGTVTLTAVPVAETGASGASLNSGSTMGQTTMTGGDFRNVGILGEAPGAPSSESRGGNFRNVGGLTSFGK